MSAPFNFEFQVMRGDSTFTALVAHPLVDQTFHAINQLGGGKSTLRLNRAAKFSVNYVAHALEDATKQAFGQRFFPFLFWDWLELFGHLQLITLAAVTGSGCDVAQTVVCASRSGYYQTRLA